MVNKRYFAWLCELVRANDKRYGNRFKLLSYLNEKEFRWDYKVLTDSDRAEDGRDLRAMFADETSSNLYTDDISEPCSVLEMLIALSVRIDRDITGEPGDAHPEHWFWEMINNLGVYNQTDFSFDVNIVDMYLDFWLDRKYDQNGVGGIFPVTHSYSDQRRISIWDQMSEYLNEKY